MAISDDTDMGTLQISLKLAANSDDPHYEIPELDFQVRYRDPLISYLHYVYKLCFTYTAGLAKSN